MPMNRSSASNCRASSAEPVKECTTCLCIVSEVRRTQSAPICSPFQPTPWVNRLRLRFRTAKKSPSVFRLCRNSGSPEWGAHRGRGAGRDMWNKDLTSRGYMCVLEEPVASAMVNWASKNRSWVSWRRSVSLLVIIWATRATPNLGAELKPVVIEPKFTNSNHLATTSGTFS